MMRGIVAFCIIMAGLLSGAANAADYKAIKIGVDGDYAPWNSKDKSGALIGFEIDLAKVLCKRMALECTFVEHHWEGMIPALQAGKFDVIMAAMTITPERMKSLAFTRAYAQVPARFVIAKSSALANARFVVRSMDLSSMAAGDKAGINAMIKAFTGKTIGVKAGSKHETFLRDFLGIKVAIRPFDNDDALDLEFQLGKVDAAFGPMSYWKPLLESDAGEDFMAVGPRIVGGPLGLGVGAAVRQEDRALADVLSTAIRDAIDDKSISILARIWFGFDASAR